MANKYLTIFQLEEKIKYLFRAGNITAEDIAYFLTENREILLPSPFRNGELINEEGLIQFINKTLNNFNSKELVEMIYMSKIYKPENDRNYYLLSQQTNDFKTLLPETLKEVLKGEKYISQTTFGVYTGYNPTLPFSEKIYNDNYGRTCINLYYPPKWKLKTLDEVFELPDIYKELLGHFCNGENTATYEYLLDWLAISLQARNRTFLLLNSKSGSGKGTLAKLVMALHGKQNSVELLAASVEKQFNSLFANKTFIFLDEISSLKGPILDKIKTFINEEIEIEKKGIDSFIVQNFMNCIFATNNIDAISSTIDDRRWSVLDITDVNLIEVWPQNSSKWQEYLMPDNIEKLASFLIHRNYNPENVNKPFKGEKSKIMESVQIQDWQEFIENELYLQLKGATLKSSDIVSYLSNMKFFKVSGRELKKYIRNYSKNIKHKVREPDGVATHYFDGFKIMKAEPGHNWKCSGTIDLISF